MNSSFVLGGGCFWCLEAAYQLVEGVTDVVPGYAGGTADTANYSAVCTGQTGHVEVVRVSYDPTVISLSQILAIFWVIHDPTSLDRQGADAGPQYASVIYYEHDEQRDAVVTSLREAQSLLVDSIVTRVEQLPAFYEAEPEHHNYFQNHPEAAYCQAVIAPKLAKLRQHFSSLATR